MHVRCAKIDDECYAALYVLKVNFVHLKPRLKDTRRQHTTAQDVLFGRRVVDLFDDAHTIEKAAHETRKMSIKHACDIFSVRLYLLFRTVD